MTGMELFIYAILLILCGMFLWELIFANKGDMCMDHPPASPPFPPPLLKANELTISNEQSVMSDYRIKQIKDDEFIVEKRAPTSIGGVFWVQCGIRQYDPEPIIHASLDAARKWISDKQKYPIYHEANPGQPERDYENLESK